MTPEEEIRIAMRALAVVAARAEEVIFRHCPGPHTYVQHRDRKPPWCNVCRYTAAGERIPERGTDA